MKEHYDTQSGANSDEYLVNEGVASHKQTIPKAVQQAAADYSVKAPISRK